MKRVLSFLLSVIIVFSMITPAVYAAYEDSYSVLTADTDKLLRGETFTVTATLTNSEIFSLAAVALSYDETVFEMVEGKCLVTGALLGSVEPSDKAGTVMLGTASAYSGDLFSFTLKVKEDATLGTAEITQEATLSLSGNTAIATEGISFEITNCKEHVFDRQLITEEYLAAEATYETAAVYYYCCACGEKGTETFSWGEPLVKPPFYDTGSILTAEKTQLVQGEAFTVTATLGNSDPITMATVALTFDDAVFELLGGECLVSDVMLGSVTVEQKAGSLMLQSETVVYGDLFAFRLRVKKDAPLGSADLEQKTAIGIGTGSYVDSEGLTFEIADCTEHTFDQEDCSADYLATEATCTARATYFYSCACGEKGAETFAWGELLDHTYDQQVVDTAYLAAEATCTAQATCYYSCVCGEKGTETFSYGMLLDHTYDQKAIGDGYLATEATYELPATYYYSCVCGKAGSETFSWGDPITEEPDYGNSSGTLTADKKAVYRGECFTVTLQITNGALVREIGTELSFDGTVFELTEGKCLREDAYEAWVIPESGTGGISFENANVVSGDLFTFTFQVKEDAPFGVYAIGSELSLGINTENGVSVTGADVEVVCDHTYCQWTDNGETHTAVCECGEYRTQEDHSYDCQVTEEQYIAFRATFTEPATYYHSCVCGKAGSGTFAWGEPLARPDIYGELTADKLQLTRGETFTVTARLTNTETINLATVSLAFDDGVFQLVSGECLVSGTMLGMVIPDRKAGTLVTQSARVLSGDLFAFTFKVKKDVPYGRYEIGNQTSIGKGTGNLITAVGMTVEVVECTDHRFEEQVATEEYLAMNATFTEPARYYYSCACGAKGQEVFSAGEPMERPEVYGELTAETLQVKRGEEFTVTARLECGETIDLGAVALFFDEGILELTGGSCCLENAVYGTVLPADKAATFLLKDAAVVSGDLFAFTFRVKEDAPFGIVWIDQRTSVGVGTGSDITAAGICLEVVCDHSYGEWAQDGEAHKAVCSVCGDVKTEDHSYGDWTDNGENHIASCAACGAVRTGDHIYDQQVIADAYWIREANCTTPAIYSSSCACGAMGGAFFEAGDALGHSFTNYASDGNATCLEDGTKTAKCDRCDETHTQADPGSALGHSFTNYASDGNATCLEDGTKTAKCDRCDETQTQADPGSALGHSFTNYVGDGNATCLEDGTKTAKCDRCDETHTQADPGSALGHSFTNYASDGNATCLEDGTKTAKCDRCDETHTQADVGSAPGHTYVDGCCAVCGHVNFIPGDINGDRQVTTDDAVQLLLHISMPVMFPLTAAPGELNGDGVITTDDAVQLLLHISMPEMFPL